MDLGVASHADREVVTVFLSDELDEVNGIVEPVVVVDPVIDTTRRITSECEQVLDALFLCLVETLENLLTCNEGACNVHEYIKAHVLLNVRTQVERDV
jgi:hypothetical protein